MSEPTLRICFAGLFAIISLVSAVLIELIHPDAGAPQWLVAIAGLAAGYAFGHAQSNGGLDALLGRKSTKTDT